ncbi:pericentriolar material 1 protein isoform X2 [Polypterus senegalus]|uniref:pericentriolar material 1 protein isoform X2 n=1 Tax=Polypterus senegalus TaxID=55291 RepID=UPI0019628BDC|nr:pericentriolar material 1 protein isoform X2 [Polypterus senegalus]
MATGGLPLEDHLDDQDWVVSNSSLEDRLNNMDWGLQHKKANRSSEKNKKKFAVAAETRLTNDISPESSPGAGRRRARTPHSFSHVKYATQMSVPEQAELERLKQKINFSDLDERSIGSDSQGRATAANNQRQFAESKKPFNFLPLHVNTNKSKEVSKTLSKETKEQSLSKDHVVPVLSKDLLDHMHQLGESREDLPVETSQIVSRLIQIREYIAKASSMRDDLVEKNEISANVERLSHLIDDLKEQEKAYLKLLQKMLARENEDEVRTIDSFVGSGSVAESTSLNIEVQSEASVATGRDLHRDAKEELENLKKQHDLLRRMLQQQEQLKALEGRQAALLAMQHKAERAIAFMDETVITETTGSVSGVSITSELNDELNDLIQRFHNQLHDSQAKSVPDNRRQAESLSLTREVSRSRSTPPSEQPPLENAKLIKLKELQEKKHSMDKILEELHCLRDQTLNNSSSCQRSMDQRSIVSAPAGAAVNHDPNSRLSVSRVNSTISHNESEVEENVNPTEKLRKLKEVHKRLNELRELVHYYEQTSDMMVDTINENTKDDETEEESIFDSDQENIEPIANLRNPKRSSNLMEMNSLTSHHIGSNNRDGRLNTECEINNRSAANLHSLNIPSVLECQYNRENSYNEEDRNEEEQNDDDDDEGSDASGSSQKSGLEADPEFAQKIHRLHTAKQKLKQLQELVAMVQDDESDDVANSAALVEETEGLQQPNNIRANVIKMQDVMKEKTREKFYEAKRKQQQKELRQLHEERRRLMEIQEKIQDLQWTCPDLQFSASSTASQPTASKRPCAASTPAVSTKTGLAKSGMDSASAQDSELWCEMRRHQILREELRQRRKQLESLMAEHQRRKVFNDNSKGGATDVPNPPQMSSNERTMATWGGSSQCVLDKGEESYTSEEVALEEEEEEEAADEESSSNDNFPAYSNRRLNNSRKAKKDGWKEPHQFSVDGNIRPLQKPRHQQQNVNLKRQENHLWVSDLSFLEEREQCMEQISQIRKQLDFSTKMYQALMQDQQNLSFMLQSMLMSPFNIMSNSTSSPQVQFLMHQLNQCYMQLSWQQNHVQRLKQILDDLVQQQEEPQKVEKRRPKHPCSSSPSPNVFVPSSVFPTLNTLNMPGVAQFSPLTNGSNLSFGFPSGFVDTSRISAGQTSEQCHRTDHNTSAKTEYMAFPKPFESSSLNASDNIRKPNGPEGDTEMQEACWAEKHCMDRSDSCIQTEKPILTQKGGIRLQSNECKRDRNLDEESLQSFSSFPDPVDPTTVTKTFRSKKASAQASLASKDKTPKSKSSSGSSRRRRKSKSRIKNPGANAVDIDSASLSSDSDFTKEQVNVSRQTQELETDFNKQTRELLENKLKCPKSNDFSSEASSDLSMFEALRDTIYSEVATLISQNEGRPHFLIELFHELQMLNTDYLRQRALYALQDIVNRHLTETKTNEEHAASLSSVVSNSELTPSESLATSDVETTEKVTESKQPFTQKANDGDAEFGDNASILSTSSNLEPFANDDLGNTVIHLDKALARIREYERMKLRTECTENSTDPASDELIDAERGDSRIQNLSVHSSSEIPCPRIDTQQLDRQIKAIMTEVIPFLKEHMEDTCSSHLLTSIRRMVLTLTQQNDESKEFVRFFHKQLGGILQDSLSKFSGRTLKECGEDLLVEISEILFNELAFFRLMQDLDENSASLKQKCKKKKELAASQQTVSSEPEKGLVAFNQFYYKLYSPSLQDKKVIEGEHSLAGACEDEDKDIDETAQKPTSCEMQVTEDPHVQGTLSNEGSGEDDDYDTEELPLSISLSKAETQALTNYGSGEDEEEEELEEFEASPVDVQTSLQASSEAADEEDQKTDEGENLKSMNVKEELAPSSTEQDFHQTIEDEDATVFPVTFEEAENKPVGKDTSVEITSDTQSATNETSPSSHVSETTVTDSIHQQSGNGASPNTSESSLPCSPDTDSPVLINDFEGESGNLSQKSDEDDFVKLEDLPVQLSVMREEELLKRIAEEQKSNDLSTETINGFTDELHDLAGNPLELKEPEVIEAQSA